MGSAMPDSADGIAISSLVLVLSTPLLSSWVSLPNVDVVVGLWVVEGIELPVDLGFGVTDAVGVFVG